MENRIVQDRTSRPEKISIALKLLYITFGIGVVRSFTLVEIFIDTRTTVSAAAMSVIYSILLFMCFCVYMTGKGRSWARIVSLALGVFIIPFSIFKDLQDMTIDPIFGMFGFGQAVFVIVALVILFQKQSSDWFREKKAI
ncbi:MAG: hypothetical protein HZB82_01260 [Deltaproteobacteria bacterium]|nr:hypothetical protein [Deltaproteobacteria bacterium]